MKAIVVNREIDRLLAVSEKPFSNRLEAAIYVHIRDRIHMSQELAISQAKELSSLIQACVYVDVDRKP